MSSKKRTLKQVARDRALLKRLRNSGTYKGKIDLRKAPTPYQLQKLKAIKGKRVPKNPPKPDKKPLPPKPKIPEGMKLKRGRMTEKQVRALKPKADHKLTTYALPFLRKGSPEREWRRFTGPQLTKFLNEYKSGEPDQAAEWKSYAVREEWSFVTKTERTDFRKSTDLYFSGVRIDEPKGGVTQRRAPNKKSNKRGSKDREKFKQQAAKTVDKKAAKKPAKKAAKKPAKK